jgi:hypothetical protein
MGRKITICLIFAFAVAVAVLLLPAAAQAQGQCTEFRAIGQATLPSPYSLLVGGPNVWGGDVYGSLGGEFLSGIFSGNDGTSYEHGVSNVGTNGTYVFNFGPDGSFTMNVSHAAWPFPPGKVGLGDYRGTAKIVQGSGRFATAAGNLEWRGPFIVWLDNNSPFGVQGRYNAEIKGFICGVQLAP